MEQHHHLAEGHQPPRTANAGLAFRPPEPASFKSTTRSLPHVRNLAALVHLDAAELAQLTGLTKQHRHLSGQALADRSSFLVSGWAMRARLLHDGRRQVLSFLVPGDIVGRGIWPSPAVDEDVIALTPVVLLDAEDLMRTLQLTAALSNLARALLAARRAEAAWMLENVVRLGRLSAVQRVAHLLLELHHRLSRVGEATPQGCALPVAQAVLADATGLSNVHVNRTLQKLRELQMATVRGGRLHIHDWEGLRALSHFQPPRDHSVLPAG